MEHNTYCLPKLLGMSRENRYDSIFQLAQRLSGLSAGHCMLCLTDNSTDTNSVTSFIFQSVIVVKYDDQL